LLRNHLFVHGVKVEKPVLVANSFDPKGQRGGFVNWAAIEQDLRAEFHANPAADVRFTTLLDVYRMPHGLPGFPKGSPPLGDTTAIQQVEREMEAAFAEPRFKAFLLRHEFEALLLADFTALKSVFHQHAAALSVLENDVSGYATAEEINHGQQTHPAARLAQAIPDYEQLKASRAFWVLADSDFSLTRARCPRFDAWLTHWEDWGAQS
jgi:hypothetical protein